ncbi:MAG TPA: serine/threonine-protein kinase [Steroidobacteraceae bacterium]|nr:serine/threonine-protein kinase [Steroidobacteraceae bacterium]
MADNAQRLGQTHSNDWKRIAPFLDQAMDLEPRERAVWLAELTLSQPEIAATVQKMLLEHEQLNAKGFLEKSPAEQFVQNSRSGLRVGAYVTGRILGRGGMGEVWLAKRDDGRFEGECAIKFLDASFASATLVDRFRREGHLLAKLTHPNIARLLDAGAAEDGTPYLALEYVDGRRIDRYCDERSLSVPERVRLFLEVIAAVAHAHTRLIVHRDLKPSNVLVTAEGQVKLLDFGIAKLLTAEVTDDGITRMEDLVLTPEYAAPEQMLGDAPSTATDVYQLGLLLYVLLAGIHPLKKSGTRAEKVRAALDGSIPQASDVADAPARKALQGDLDAILSMALRKSPSERYPTAQAMQDDLVRYLNSEPVHARRGAALYRTRKFVYRHRVVVAATFLIVIGLAGGLFVVNEQRVIAERRFDQLRQLSGKVFEFDESIRSLQGSTEARRQLLAASLEYLEGLAADARGDIELEYTLADAYWKVARIQGVPSVLNLGDTVKAEEQLTKAAFFASEVLRERPDDVNSLYLAAMIASDRMILADTEKRDTDAVMHAHAAFDAVERTLDLGDASKARHRDLLVALQNIAIGFMNQSLYEDATRVVRRGLAVAASLPPETVWNQTSQAFSVLGNVLRLQGDVEGALTAIREARRIAEKWPFENETARIMGTYGIYLREGFILGEANGISLNRPQEAAAAFQRALDVVEEAARRDPKDAASRFRIATVSSELGDVLLPGEPQKALAIYDAALRWLDDLPVTPRRRRAEVPLLTGASYALIDLGRIPDARARVKESLSIIKETEEASAANVAGSLTYSALHAMASLDAKTGKTDQAIVTYTTLLEQAASADPSPQSDLRAAFALSGLYEDLGNLYAKIGNNDQAAALAAKRTELWKHWQGRLPNNSVVARQLEQLANAANGNSQHRRQ